MANLKLKILVKESKNVKGKSVQSMKEIKTDGSPEAIKKAIEKLQKTGAKSFEVVDEKNKTKTLYNRLLRGNNYEQKLVKL